MSPGVGHFYEFGCMLHRICRAATFEYKMLEIGLPELYVTYDM